MQDHSAPDPRDSDFLPWALAAAALLIMAVAVRINATEPGAPGPVAQEPGGHAAGPPPVEQRI
jgi:hypothetical protein